MQIKDRAWLERIKYNQDGLIPVITQDEETGRILMLAWMNEKTLEKTVDEEIVTYWSRSRGKNWTKGEESGHIQTLVSVQLDCDGDALLLKVRQKGGIACHTGRNSCFYSELDQSGWTTIEPVLKPPEEIYQDG